MDKNQFDTTNLNITHNLEVNLALSYFLTNIKAILKNDFVGMYLYGSLALGDFDLLHSDIDFIVVTKMDLTEKHFQLLQNMHENFKNSGSFWSDKIEAAYIPQEALNESVPTDKKYPQIEKERNFSREPLEIGWAFQAHTLREYGIVIEGPNPHSLLKPIDFQNMRQAAISIVTMWLKDSNDESWLEWLKIRKEQAFVIQTLCRSLYLMKHRTVVSKVKATEWAQNTLDKKWSELIVDSQNEKYESIEISDADLINTISFIKYTLESLR